MFRNADKMAMKFSRLRGEGAISGVVVDGFIEVVVNQRADVRCMAKAAFNGCTPFQNGACKMVKEVASVVEAKEPTIVGGAGAIHDVVGSLFDGTIAGFTGVLVLVHRFTLPVSDAVGAKNITDFVRDFRLRLITEEAGHGSPLPNVIL